MPILSFCLRRRTYACHYPSITCTFVILADRIITLQTSEPFAYSVLESICLVFLFRTCIPLLLPIPRVVRGVRLRAGARENPASLEYVTNGKVMECSFLPHSLTRAI
jgi:hypothetical protein